MAANPTMKVANKIFMIFTLDYGRAFYAFNIAWYQNLLETLKKDIP